MTQDELRQEILSMLSPTMHSNVQRFFALLERSEAFQVVAVGKYNHGKSTLLNALSGRNAFSVADRRETRQVQTTESHGVVWIDTPGLDADVQGEDDRLAIEAATAQADLLLLVHNVRSGELDAHECAFAKKLLRDAALRDNVALVVTQKDQLTDEACAEVLRRIEAQLPEMTHRFVVAAVLDAHEKAAVRTLSGIPALRAWIGERQQQAAATRHAALEALHEQIVRTLRRKRQEYAERLFACGKKRVDLEERFAQKVTVALQNY